MLDVTLGSLYDDIQGYVPALLENLRGMSSSKTYWLLGGGWFQCRYGGFLMVSYYLKFHEKYGTLHEFACHPCAGAMLIFSVSFQF